MLASSHSKIHNTKGENMNSNIPLAPNCVIPAQAGVQQGQIFREAVIRDVAPLRRRFYNHLDSRLRGNDGLRDAEIANIPSLTALTGALRCCSSLVWLATPHSERLALHPASTAKNGTLAISAPLKRCEQNPSIDADLVIPAKAGIQLPPVA